MNFKKILGVALVGLAFFFTASDAFAAPNPVCSYPQWVINSWSSLTPQEQGGYTAQYCNGLPSTAPASMDFKGLVNFLILSFIRPVVAIILAAAVVFFLWNMFQAVRTSNQPEELAKFKSKVVWGIIALAVMVSVYGLVNFITRSLNLDTTTGINVRITP